MITYVSVFFRPILSFELGSFNIYFMLYRFQLIWIEFVQFVFRSQSVLVHKFIQTWTSPPNFSNHKSYFLITNSYFKDSFRINLWEITTLTERISVIISTQLSGYNFTPTMDRVDNGKKETADAQPNKNNRSGNSTKRVRGTLIQWTEFTDWQTKLILSFHLKLVRD